MPGTAKSSVITTNPKPNNVFYIWYTELCRRLNSNPAAIVRPAKPKCNTVLDFAADRLKFEDWSPLINALRHDTSLHVINIRSRMGNYQFLHDVNTEDKARRMRRKYGSLWTDYILNSLVRALSYSIKNTQVLTCLELDGLPMFSQYLDGLLKALKENRTVKNFSLTNCSIQDTGCRSLCLCLQLMPNVESLNLSRCDLTSVSGIYIAKLIKFQQLNRYTTSWHKSLRYSEPDSEKMCGIRRITLNYNPKLGDEGLGYILDELEDDLWIKALDMQKCGISENIANKLLDVLEYNQSLQIADFRQNEDLSDHTLEKILEILRTKGLNDDSQSKFQWCNTVVSLCPSTIPSTSRGIMTSATDKIYVSPPQKMNGIVKDLRKTKTVVDMIMKGINGAENAGSINGTKKNLIQLNVQINNQEEGRRKEGSIRNENLRRKINKTNHMNGEVELNHTLNSVIKTFGKLQFSNDHTMLKDAPTNTPNATPKKRKDFSAKYSNGMNGTTNGMKIGFKIEEEKTVNAANSASDLFALYVGSRKERISSSSDEEQSLMSYCDNYDTDLSEIRKNSEKYLIKNDLSDSQLSLFDYMEELKKDNAEISSDPKISTPKHHYKGKKNGIK